MQVLTSLAQWLGTLESSDMLKLGSFWKRKFQSERKKRKTFKAYSSYRLISEQPLIR